MSDETHLSDFSGDKKAWPIYLTIGNILSKYRNKPSNHCVITLALLPIPPKRKNLTFEQQESIDRILQRILKSILQPLNNVSQTGIILDCSDNHKWVCFSYLYSWVADHMKHIQLLGLFPKSCPVCKIPPDELEHFHEWGTYMARDYQAYIE